VHELLFAERGEALHLPDNGAHVAHGFDDIARAGFALGTDHGRAFGDAAQSLAKVASAADEGNLESVLPDVVFFVRRGEHFALVNVIHFKRFEHLRFGEMADAHLGHHRDGDGGFDFANHARRGHACHAAFLTDVGWNALERHHGAGAGVFGDFCLIGVGDVHNDAALQHFRQAYFYSPQIVVHQVHWFLP
jgi:hypothetical protein